MDDVTKGAKLATDLTPMTSRIGRVEGLDVARGVAGLIMIQGHAYHGWVADEHHGSFAYQLTRLLGTLPLPAFLFLSGVSLAYRVQAAALRDEEARRLRARIAFRGLQIVLAGYAISLLYAAIDGSQGLSTLLRSDVLHVIGLSIAAVASIGIGARSHARRPDLARLRTGALAIAAVALAVGPTINRLTSEVPFPLAYAAALFGDVAGVSRMPFFPLVVWTCAGAVIGSLLRPFGPLANEPSANTLSGHFETIAGIAKHKATVLLFASLGLALVFDQLTETVVSSLGGSLTRAHPAIAFNVLDLGARGALIFFGASLLAPYLPQAPRRGLMLMGRYSLWAYVAHIPFCYGAFARPISGKLSMPEASLWLLPLFGLGYAAVVARHVVALMQKRRRRAQAPNVQRI